MNEIITVRDLAMVTSDIQGAQKRGAIQLVSSLIEIGGLLAEAKTMVEPKAWEKYIMDNFGYSTSTADNWMKLYREYGDDQASFFTKLQDSQTFGKLSYTKLLALTDIPAEERLEFAEQNHVEDMSTRELQKAIRERDEARKALVESEDKLLDAEAGLEDAKSRAAEAETENKELRDKAKKAQKAQESAEADLKKLQKKLSDAEKAAKKATEDAKRKAENPEVPASVMEQMRAEIAAEEAKKAAAGLQKELEEALKTVENANRAREEAERKLQEQQKASTMANPDVAVFKAHVQQVKADFDRLTEVLMRIGQTDPATAEQLKKVSRQLLDKLREEIS